MSKPKPGAKKKQKKSMKAGAKPAPAAPKAASVPSVAAANLQAMLRRIEGRSASFGSKPLRSQPSRRTGAR